MSKTLGNTSNPLLLLLIAGFMSALSGCGTPLPRVEKVSMENLPFKAEREGIVVALRPVTTKDELEKTFGNDLLEFKMLPIQVNISNHHPSASFIVEAKNFTLNNSAVRASREVLPSPGTAMWLGGGGLIGGTLAANRENSKVSMALAEFRTYTISPGKFAQGFLFFQLPSKGAISDTNWRLRVRLDETESDHEVDFDIPFNATLR